MEPQGLQLLPIHENPEYIQECCDLINEEWPRSTKTRMSMLTSSRPTMPTSLVLISGSKVIGHCKLTKIPSIPNSCFLETVVISKALRGKKLGTYMMKKTEDYCRKVLKLSMLHLSTKGQEKFYSKLGYEVCPRVSLYGMFIPNYFTLLTANDMTITNNKSVPVKTCEPHCGAPPPPPPPPPPMPQNDTQDCTLQSNDNKTYMFKYL